MSKVSIRTHAEPKEFLEKFLDDQVEVEFKRFSRGEITLEQMSRKSRRLAIKQIKKRRKARRSMESEGPGEK